MDSSTDEPNTRPNPLHWFVLGAGCIGTVLSFRLSRHGVPCSLLSHRGAGVRRIVVDGESHEVRVEALEAQAPGSIRRLLLTTKAGQIDAALELALPRLATDAILLTTANGLGFAESIRSCGVELPLQRAVSTAAAYRDEAGNVVLAAIGNTRVGCRSNGIGPAPWFKDSLAQLPDWQWDPEIAHAIERKFAINCVINPLTAERRCLNGELLDAGAGEALLVQLAEEVELNLRVLDLWHESTCLEHYVREVCRSTAANNSSMLQDVLAGRPTEIDFLTGELLRRRTRLGAAPPAPLCEALYGKLSLVG